MRDLLIKIVLLVVVVGASLVFVNHYLKESRGMANDFAMGSKAGYELAQVDQQAAQCDRGGNAIACFETAAKYQSGQGVTRNLETARAYFIKACDLKFVGGCAGAGILYEGGNGLAADQTQATTMLRKACDLGDAPSCQNLATHYRKGLGIDKDEAQAKELDHRVVLLHYDACEKGTIASCALAGDDYRLGRGVSKDPKLAGELLKKACDGGDRVGCQNLSLSKK